MDKKIFSLVIVAILVYACNTGSRQSIIASQETVVDTAAGSCPYLTKDKNNNIVLSWIKQVDTATNIFCYAVSTDQGKTFGKPVKIPGSKNVHPHGENMPKIICKPSGEIIAAWGAANPNPKNAYSGLVYYSQSFDDGKTWSTPRSLTTDTASFDQRYFDMALLPNGEAAIVWLDNRKTSTKEGSGLYYTVTNSRHGFEQERLISEPCCQCCRTDLFIDRNKNIHVLYRAIINDSIRDMVHIVSTDEGKTFTPPKRISNDNWVISGCPHTGPAMTENKDGLHFTWFTGGSGAGIYFSSTTNNGRSFSQRDSVSGKAAKHCQVTTLPNNKILIVWNENVGEGNQSSSRIGLEVRDAKGASLTKEYITGIGQNASFPVIQAINNNKVLVAYTNDTGNKQQVYYKLVSIK